MTEQEIQAAEREKCAQIAEFWGQSNDPQWNKACAHIAGEIRDPGSMAKFEGGGLSGTIYNLTIPEDLP